MHSRVFTFLVERIAARLPVSSCSDINFELLLASIWGLTNYLDIIGKSSKILLTAPETAQHLFARLKEIEEGVRLVSFQVAPPPQIQIHSLPEMRSSHNIFKDRTGEPVGLGDFVLLRGNDQAVLYQAQASADGSMLLHPLPRGTPLRVSALGPLSSEQLERLTFRQAMALLKKREGDVR